MPLTIIKNRDTECLADGVVKPVYPQKAFGVGKASLVEAPENGSREIRVVCPKNFNRRLLHRGYLACIRLAKEEGFCSLEIPVLLPKERKNCEKAALHLAVKTLGAVLAEDPLQVYVTVHTSEELLLPQTLRQKLMQYIEKNQWVSAPLRAVQSAQECSPWEKMAMPAEAPSQKTKAAMHAPSIKGAKLKEIIGQVDAGFSETLLKYIDQSGKKDSEIYRKANVSRQHFSKIRKNPYYKPTKPTAIAFAIALELNMEQTRDLIGRAGYALTRSSLFDLIIMYFIENRNYNIYEINEALFEFDQSLLGT